MSPTRIALAVLLPSLLMLSACNRQPTRVKPPAINPQQAAAAAMAEYDSNGDGTLDEAELEKAPALSPG